MSKQFFPIFKSPILHFIILGIAAFFLYEKFRLQDRDVIHVTTQTIDALAQQRESKDIELIDEKRLLCFFNYSL